MKSPLVTLACCVAGIVAAGLPLVWFTAAPAPAVSAAPVQPRAGVSAALLVRYTDAMGELVIRHEGSELCRIVPPDASGYWMGQVHLPVAPAPGMVLELEVETAWPAARVPTQAVTLELEPPQLPAACDTQWTEPDENYLHSIFTFRW